MHKRLTLSVAMLVIGVAMLAAASVASAGSDSKRAAPQSSAARKGGTMKFSLFAGIENIDPQRSYYVPEWQYELLTARPLVNFAHATGARGYRVRPRPRLRPRRPRRSRPGRGIARQRLSRYGEAQESHVQKDRLSAECIPRCPVAP